MDFEINFTKETDYEQLALWWSRWKELKVWNGPPPSINMLPNNLKDGLMVSYKGENICAGFIYRTPSAFCWMEYIVSNPNIKNREVRKLSKPFLINSLLELAKKMGYEIVFSSIENKHLIKNYLDCGFYKGSKTIEMVKNLN